MWLGVYWVSLDRPFADRVSSIRTTDILQFIAAIVAALAWPLAVVVVALLFRASVGKLIPGLSRLKWKDLELEFKKELAHLSAAAQQAQLPPPPINPPLPARGAQEPLAQYRILEREIDA